MSLKLANLIGIPVVGLHQGQRTYAPRHQAGHMTAADQTVQREKSACHEAVHICLTGADGGHSTLDEIGALVLFAQRRAAAPDRVNGRRLRDVRPAVARQLAKLREPIREGLLLPPLATCFVSVRAKFHSFLKTT
jgi:hypothetical protein